MATFDKEKLIKSLQRRYGDNTPEEVTEYWDKKIDEEFKRRNRKGAIAEDPKDYARGRHLGRQDIGDISYKEPWQKIVRDQLGITMPINTMYRCPTCGKEYALDMPPERCIYCGTYSFLHQRGFINLKF